MRRRPVAPRVGDVSEAATADAPTIAVPPLGRTHASLSRAEARLRNQAIRGLLDAGFSRLSAMMRASTLIRAMRMQEAWQLLEGVERVRYARALEVADKQVAEITRAAGLEQDGPTRSGPRPSRSRVQRTPSTEPARACEADAVEDAIPEAPAEAVHNTPDDGADRPET